MKLGLKLYLGASILGTISVIAHSIALRGEFFTAALTLAVDRPKLLVVLNFLVICSLCVSVLFKNLFLGALEDREVEALQDRMGPAIFETLLAMTVFSGEVLTIRFGMLFLSLLILKAFHWMADQRIDFSQTEQQQQQQVAANFKTLRLVCLVASLVGIDAFIAWKSWNEFLELEQTSAILLFAFEYTLLLALACYSASKLVIFVVDCVHEGRWEKKSEAQLYSEVIFCTIQLACTITFFFFVVANDTLPLHLTHRLIISFTRFRRRTLDLIEFRKMNAALQQRFPLVSLTDFPNADPTCIVCREDMLQGRLLPCGHILHEHCLRSWLTRQQTCPICQHPVMRDHPAIPNVFNNNNNNLMNQNQNIIRNQHHNQQEAAAAAAMAPPQPMDMGLFQPWNLPNPPRTPQKQSSSSSTTANMNNDEKERGKEDVQNAILTQIDSITERMALLQSEIESVRELALSMSNQSSTTTTTTTTNNQPQQKSPSENDTEELRRRRLLRFSQGDDK